MILGDLASDSQQVNQILDIGIEVANVIADGSNVCVQRAALFMDMEDHGSVVNVTLMDDDLEECWST